MYVELYQIQIPIKIVRAADGCDICANTTSEDLTIARVYLPMKVNRIDINWYENIQAPNFNELKRNISRYDIIITNVE